ncbi:MAG: arylsulfatase [Planctomycetaceae bacterium]
MSLFVAARRVCEVYGCSHAGPSSRLLTAALVAMIAAAVWVQRAEAQATATDTKPRPNIVYILADDMGFSDIGCYGGEIATPNLNSLAENGLRFTQFYNTGRCCPTRASLLTGLYPHQAGIGHMMDDRGFDGYRGELSRNCVTIAEVLRPAGYRCYAVGKWHVTKAVRPDSADAKHNWPLQRGFDRFYGTIHGAGSFFDPNTLTRDNQFISPFADPEYPTDDYYYTDAIADHAVRFVTEHQAANADSPFFMYVAFTAAHWPMHAREAAIAKYKGRYAGGYQAVRDARYARMLELGVIDKDATENWPVPDAYKEQEYWDWDQRNMEVYAAMVETMDQGIGRIVQSLKQAGQFDNTLICFLQDNGGCQEEMGRKGIAKPRAAQPTLPPLADDYLQPDMIPKQTRDGYPVRQGKGAMAGGPDTYAGYGYGWATVSNTPFRMFKHFTHEGGISTPLIVHWPKGVARAGEREATPGHLIDLMATAVDLSEAKYPTRVGGHSIKPMEGKSLRPLFEGKPIEREALYWEHEGNRAVRVGDYKLVSEFDHPWELYHIAKDRSEQHDLSDSQPERVQQLEAMWQAYADRADVQPWEKVQPPPAQRPAGQKRAAKKPAKSKP